MYSSPKPYSAKVPCPSQKKGPTATVCELLFVKASPIQEIFPPYVPMVYDPSPLSEK